MREHTSMCVLQVADELAFVASLGSHWHDLLGFSSGAIWNLWFGIATGTAHVLTVAKAF
jgi:hypothetical protein